MLALSDKHYPNADHGLVEKVHDYNDDAKPDYIVDLGDLFDNDLFSRYDKDPRNEASFEETLDMVRYYSNRLRQKNKKARIIYKRGNHDLRIDKYAIKNAPNLVKAGAIKTLEELINLPKLKIEHYEYNDRLVIEGNLKITHGTTVAQLAGYSAHAELRKAGTCSGISGHTHRLGFVAHRGRTWLECGHMCTLDMSKFLYMADGEGDWQQGFAVGKLVQFNDGSKQWLMQPIQVVNGSFIIDGVVY